MKVAVFEPFPRICGVTVWSFHLAQGFRDAGHQCDVVSFSKSGKARTTRATRRDGSIGQGWHFWHESPDVWAKWTDAPSVLDSYDLIVLNEPKNGTSDREAQRAKQDTPDYVWALHRTSTPWITALHAPYYDEKRSPFLHQCVTAPSFTGVAIEHQGQYSYPSGEWAFQGNLKKVQEWPWLPYRMKRRQDDPEYDVSRHRVIAITGRMTPNKGHGALAYHGDRFPSTWQTHLYGAESGGNGTCYSYDVFEKMSLCHGWVGQRLGKSEKPYDGTGIYNSGDTLYQWPWWLMKGGHVVQYHNTYTDAFRVGLQSGVSVNLTSQTFSVALEYTTLEAMNAGCAIVAPSFPFRFTGRDQYSVYTLDWWNRTMGLGKNGFRVEGLEDACRELVWTVNDACHAFERGEHEPEKNVAALQRYHDPVYLARQIERIL